MSTAPHQAQSASGEAAHRPLWRSLQWWPSLAAIAFAAFVALGLFSGEEGGADLAPIVAASGLVYLAAAALEKPIVAWIAFFVSVAIITLARQGVVDIDATWFQLALAALLLIVGLVRGALRSASGLPLQALAMLGFGAIAVTASAVNATLGAYLVAAGLFAHAGWDAYHHRANRVVARSMSEFCFMLDLLLAGAIVIVTIRA
jgi:hypothetical protein